MKQEYKVSQPYVLGTNATKWVVGKGKSMATLQVRIEDGFFVGTNGCYVSLVEPTHVVANGWDCSISEDGTIMCEAVRVYSDGEHSIRYLVQPNGFAKLTLKVPNEKVRTLRKGFVLPKGSKLSDGMLGLAGGNIDSRYAYFRDGSFQKFLEDRGISAVKHEDPNRLYSVRNARYGGGECYSYLLTDGTVEEEEFSSGRTDSWAESCPGTGAYEGEQTLKVSGATWVIHKQVQSEGDKHNSFALLYTLEKDPTSLVGIPNIREKEQKISRMKEVGSRGFLSIEEMEKALREIAPKLRKKGTPVKDPEYIKVTRECYYSQNMLETNQLFGLINFTSSSEAQKALEELSGLKFESPEELEEFLRQHGYDAELTRYYAFVSSNAEKTNVWIEMRPSTNRGRGFDGFCEDIWTAEI